MGDLRRFLGSVSQVKEKDDAMMRLWRWLTLSGNGGISLKKITFGELTLVTVVGKCFTSALLLPSCDLGKITFRSVPSSVVVDSASVFVSPVIWGRELGRRLIMVPGASFRIYYIRL